MNKSKCYQISNVVEVDFNVVELLSPHNNPTELHPNWKVPLFNFFRVALSSQPFDVALKI